MIKPMLLNPVVLKQLAVCQLVSFPDHVLYRGSGNETIAVNIHVATHQM